MIKVEELWTQQDQWSLDLCIGAVAREDVARALLALEGVPADAQRRAEETLSGWAAQVPSVAPPADDPAQTLRALLVDTLGFRGDPNERLEPHQSHLTAVLKRRRGLPILLSAVWIAVGRDAGIPVEGIGLPGRFLVRVGGAAGVYVDPSGGGQRWSEADCRQHVQELTGGRLTWDDAFLEPVDTQALLARVCRNLVGTYDSRNETAPLYRTLRFLEAMTPDDPDVPLMRARVAETVGAFPRALKIYRALAQAYPDTDAGAHARERLAELARLTVAET